MTRTKRILALLADSKGTATLEQIISSLSEEDRELVMFTINNMVHHGYLERVPAIRITDGGEKRLAHRRLTRQEYRERYKLNNKIKAIRKADHALGAM